MASSKESRPVSGSLPRHASSSRTHSHSVSLAASNPAHRINRRKSINAQASSTATAAVAAALREQGGDASSIQHANHRRSLGSKKGLESYSMTSRPNMSSYFGNGSADQDALDDNSNEDEAPQEKKMSTKARNRRASEGSFLKGEGKRSASELRCDTCGKGYKHSSCLTKHLWEHDPAWQYTSKLLISKHQQVQLLEAASVLFNMNAEAPANPEASQANPSEGSSGSPAYSASSDVHEELSSVETTPPPMSEAAYPMPEGKRHSTQSSNGFSRSYRSIPSSSFAESLVSPGLPPRRYSGVTDFRPDTSGTDDSGLAAAAELLNFGTPRTRPTLGSDVPPVPPLPQQYQSLNNNLSGSTTTTVYKPLGMHPTQQLSDERVERMDEEQHHDAHTSNEDEEGMFRMEE